MKLIPLILLFFISSAQAEPVLVFNTTGKSPLNRPDKTGFMDQVTQQALADIGYQLETVKLPAERGLKNVNLGVDDAEMSRIKGLNKIYSNMVRVPEKIMNWEFVVFSKKTINLDKGWQSLADKNIAFINGWKILENNVPSTAGIIKVKSDQQLFTLLDKNRTDYIIYEKWSGLEIIRNNNYKEIKLLSPPLAIKEMFIYLNNKHESLVAPLSKALKGLKESGKYQAIESKLLIQ